MNSDSHLVWKGKVDFNGEDTTEETTTDTLHSEVDKEWETYWEANGQSLVLTSWIEKYKDYINPEHLSSSTEVPASHCAENTETRETTETLPEYSTTESAWAELWKAHAEEQYSYYKNWFYEWWAASQETESQQSTTASTEHDIDPVDELLDNFNQVAIESIMADNESSSSKEQKDKTNLEKTKDFLAKMGFSGIPDASSSCITSCQVLARKKKRKKTQQPVSHVSVDATNVSIAFKLFCG